ncbi:MAG: septum site-determining protein Ssd [Candidatus Nanopelagicales bacterium]
MSDVVVRVSDPGLEREVRGIARSAGVTVADAVGTGTRLVVSDRFDDPVISPDGIPLVLVAPSDGVDLWRGAAAAGAEQVVVLPDGAALLDRRLRRPTRRPQGVLVRVVGARGGVGATSVAVGMAVAAADRRVVLVDADPHGAGLDLTLGVEQDKGLRWDDLAEVRGQVPPRSILGRLPVVAGVPVLSHRRGAPPEQPAWAAVTDSVLGAADVVVADVPRYWVGRLPVVTRTIDILVVPHDVAAVAAARALLDSAAVRADAIVALRRVKGPLVPAAVTEALPQQTVVEIPHTSALGAAADFGDLARAVSRGAFASACRHLLEVVAGRGGS